MYLRRDVLSQSLAAKSSDALRAELQEIGTRASTGDLVDEVDKARAELYPPVLVGSPTDLGTVNAADGQTYRVVVSKTNLGFCYGFLSAADGAVEASDLPHCLLDRDLTGLATASVASRDFIDPGIRLGVVSDAVAAIRQGKTEESAEPIEIRSGPEALSNIRFFFVPLQEGTTIFAYGNDGRPIHE